MCPQLEKLFVNGCDMITDDGIVPIAEKCGQQLKELEYSGCTKCTDAALKSIVNNCNQLEELDAENCGISTIPENIGYKLTKLKKLYLSNNKITKIPFSLTLLKDTLKDDDGYFNISGCAILV
jgi:Leucine-rich repeat (LRR) protein